MKKTILYQPTIQKRRKKRKSKTGFICLVLLCNFLFPSLASVYTLSPEVQKIFESRGEYQALEYCRNWLAGNKTDFSEDYYSILQDYFYLEEDPNLLLPVFRDAAGRLVNQVDKGIIYLHLAEVEEMMGNIAKARQSYHNASLLLKEDKEVAIVNSARLFFEQGYYSDAWLELNRIPNTIGNNEVLVIKTTLRALLSLAKNEKEKAVAYFEKILKEYSSTEFFAAAVFQYIAYLNGVGESAYAEKLTAQLKKQFPTAPEIDLLAHSSQILLMPVPHTLAAKFDSGSSDLNLIPTPQPAETEAKPHLSEIESSPSPDMPVPSSVADNIKTYIQTGSFSVKENAEYLLKDLEAKNFKVTLGEKKVAGVLYHVVLVEPGGDFPDIDSLLTSLQSAGFNGFRVILPH